MQVKQSGMSFMGPRVATTANAQRLGFLGPEERGDGLN